MGVAPAAAHGDNEGMWLILGAAAAAAFWLFVFDTLERRRALRPLSERSRHTRLH
jgi:hypothetical protein